MIKFLMVSVLVILLRIDSFAAQLVFQTPPEYFQPKMEVAACFIKVEDHFLFLKRHPLKREGSTWGIPGGIIDKGESPEKGMIREVLEETGIDLSKNSLKYFGKVYIRYPNKDFIYHMFETTLQHRPDKVVINPIEHTEFRWMNLQDALEYPLIPGEDECIFLVY